MRLTYTVSHCTAPDWANIEAVTLTHTGWLSPCPIEAIAQLCCDGNTLYVRMEAVEHPVRATLTGALDAVCTDSCLEFFLAPIPGDPRYFNFEFNPLGTLCLAFGETPPNRIRQIPRDTASLLQPKPFTTAVGWGIEFQIPLHFLQLYFPGYTFSGEGRGNFYKCGDSTGTPHYLAWSPLSADAPDYHRPQDFGTLLF